MKVGDIIRDNSVWIPNPNRGAEDPVVSVLLPTYSRSNRGYLKTVVDSVLKQSYRQIELIVVDDGSTDNTMDVCKAYMKKDPRVHLIRHRENLGLPAISNYEAYVRARGEYIAFAFDDNIWYLDAIEKTIRFMEANQVKACYGIRSVVDPVSGESKKIGESGDFVDALLWSGNRIGAGNVVVHKSVLEDVGLHDPHLSLTRACDWDLWQRIAQKYKFVASGVNFSYEKGPRLRKSLGNSLDIDQWFFRERQQTRDPAQLKPENFHTEDVTECSPSNSAFFHSCMADFYQQYTGKYWFEPNKSEEIRKQPVNHALKRIIVYAVLKSASEMNFSRYLGNNYVMAYCLPGTAPSGLLAAADAVVYSRAIPKAGGVDEAFAKLSIPQYYFTDDNFLEISVGSDDPALKQLARAMTRENLSRFEAIIVTTEALRRYFLEKELHDRVIVFPPVWKKPTMRKTGPRPITVGYMGGPFRDGVMEACLLPALRNIAKERELRFICPASKENREQILAFAADGLEIIPFERTITYEYAVNTYEQIGVDIFVHCGEDNCNSVFKTKNALINAVSLASPLVVSDTAPYNDRSDGSENTYLVVNNTPEDWEAGLRFLIENPEEREALFWRAYGFCREHYSVEAAWAELDRELADKPEHTNFQYYKRMEKYCDWIVVHNMINAAASGSFVRMRRVVIPEDLSFSNEIRFPRTYGITATADRINAVGLLFGVSGSCKGKVKLRLLGKNGEPLAVSRLSIDELWPDDYTVFHFDYPVEIPFGETIKVEIDVDYTEKNGFVGLFEDRKNRTFIYKVCNKLGFPIPGRNALFADMGIVR